MSVTTTKRLDLPTLQAALGAGTLRCDGDPASDAEKTLTSSVSDDDLAAAVAAHVYVDRTANATSIRQAAAQALAGNRAYVALASPTAAQTAAQVKALCRQQNALIRLALGHLDGTD